MLLELLAMLGVVFVVFGLTIVVNWLIEPFMMGDKWTWRRGL